MRDNNLIIPFQGVGEINFSMTFEDAKLSLRAAKNIFNIEHWPNKGCDPEVAWDIIRTKDAVSIFFAKGRMFKIYVERGFSGALSNGITTGMTVEEARQIDPQLVFDDNEEIFTSPAGYWLEESLQSGRIETITVFIPAILDDDLFFSYNWCHSDND